MWSQATQSRFVVSAKVIGVVLSLLLLYHIVTPNEDSEIPGYLSAIGGFVSGSSSIIQHDGGLRALCDETQWTEGLWLHCHSGSGPNGTSMLGGLNNARNRLQTCLRLAIDAGAGLVIAATAMTRNSANLVIENSDGCPETFWDIKNLQKEMKLRCPQLKLRHCGDVSGIPTILKTHAKNWREGSFVRGTFKEWMQNHLDTDTYRIDTSAINRNAPVAVEFSDSYKGWDYRASNELATIRKGLFRSLRYNAKILSIGSQILQREELRNGYIGIHFRGEPDWPAGFGSAAQQMDFYTAELERLAIENIGDPSFHKTVYISCGSEEAIERFRERIAPLGYTTYSKISLLSKMSPELLEQVKEMSFDERAIVEYDLLVSAERFMGVVMSTFSSIVAFARTIDEEGDFFDQHVFPGSYRDPNDIHRVYPELALKGDDRTLLLVVNGDDVMDSFP